MATPTSRRSSMKGDAMSCNIERAVCSRHTCDCTACLTLVSRHVTRKRGACCTCFWRACTISTVVAGRSVVAIQSRRVLSRHLCATQVMYTVYTVSSGITLVDTGRPARTSVDLGVESVDSTKPLILRIVAVRAIGRGMCNHCGSTSARGVQPIEVGM